VEWSETLPAGPVRVEMPSEEKNHARPTGGVALVTSCAMDTYNFTGEMYAY